jgi:phosphatidylglycerophosphatase A
MRESDSKAGCVKPLSRTAGEGAERSEAGEGARPSDHPLGLPFRHPAVTLATGFGVGLLPIAPGSWASFAALPLAWGIRSLFGCVGLAVASAVAFFVGCWAAGIVAKASAVKDPGAVVIDEIAGQWLVLLAAPLDPLAYALAFLLFRGFDTWKPWPARWADRHVKGGLGIVLDDLLAAVYAVFVLLGLLATRGVFGVRN